MSDTGDAAFTGNASTIQKAESAIAAANALAAGELIGGQTKEEIIGDANSGQTKVLADKKELTQGFEGDVIKAQNDLITAVSLPWWTEQFHPTLRSDMSSCN